MARPLISPTPDPGGWEEPPALPHSRMAVLPYCDRSVTGSGSGSGMGIHIFHTIHTGRAVGWIHTLHTSMRYDVPNSVILDRLGGENVR